MLDRKESAVMNAVYELCDGSDCCLISRADILSLLPAKTRDRCNLDDVLFGLHCDGYFDLIIGMDSQKLRWP